MTAARKRTHATLQIYGVLVHYESPSQRTEKNPHGKASRAWPVAATSMDNAEARARAELATLDERASVTRVRVTLVEGASYEPSPDVTLAIGNASFTYKQPGSPKALKGQ